MMGKGIKNTCPLGRTKSNLNYAFLESCSSNGCCLKGTGSQHIPAVGEQCGDQRDRPLVEGRSEPGCHDLCNVLLQSACAMRCWGKMGPLFSPT